MRCTVSREPSVSFPPPAVTREVQRTNPISSPGGRERSRRAAEQHRRRCLVTRDVPREPDRGAHHAAPGLGWPAPPSSAPSSYLLAAPRQRVELTFDEHFYIEPSFECRFDHLEVRDGPFGFSPLIDRFCGVKSPPLIRSTGRFMWVKFSSDEELEGLGFRAKYSFIPGNEIVLFRGWASL